MKELIRLIGMAAITRENPYRHSCLSISLNGRLVYSGTQDGFIENKVRELDNWGISYTQNEVVFGF